MNNTQERVLGSAPEFLRVVHAARMVAPTDAPVLVAGEPGAGKELLAREIHLASRRSENPFIIVNCAGISDSQLADELTAASPGATLFLDGVGDLSLDAQAKLLHFLESMDSGRSGYPDLRIIASSARDLTPLLDTGAFREDLFYRLHVVPIELPPLRERGDDVILMLKQFTADLARHHGRKAPRYSVTVRNLIKQYTWPGNVRELHNFCEQMVILMAGNIVQPENMPLEMRRKPERQVTGEARFILPEKGIDILAMEGDMIRQAIGMAGGNRSKAARLLGLSRDTLLYRIQKHAIEM